MLEILNETKPEQLSRFAVLGAVTHLVTRTREYSGYSASSIRVWIEPAIDFDLIRVFYKKNGDPVAYVCFAYLEADVEARLLEDSQFRLHPSEWTEGKRLFLLDFVAPFGHAAAVARALRADPLVQAAGEIFFARKRKAGGALRRGMVRVSPSGPRRALESSS